MAVNQVGGVHRQGDAVVVAQDRQPPAQAQAVDAFRQSHGHGVAAHRFHHHIRAGPAGQLPNPLRQILLPAVDQDIRAKLGGPVQLVRGNIGGDNPRPHNAGQLQGVDAQAANADDDHRLPGLRPGPVG